MTRFEIQDIVRQNQDGVTFRTLDKSTKQIVSLRRFFPFGQDEEGGEGLDPQEGKAFSSACEKLSEVHHPALRKTIFGDTDPVDGMPFLVTEWIDGESLSNVLGNNTMDPSLIIGLARQALDVCMILSSALGKEAVWIDTKLESIIVSNPSENPSFSFRICPFKWLGTQSHEKDLTSIASMVEALMGWKSKLVSDQGGLGLGGWLKMLRQHPEMSLQAALDCLPSQNIEQSVIAPQTTTYTQTAQPHILPSASQSTFTKKSVTIMAISACVTTALIFFLYQNKQKQLTSNAVVPIEVEPAVVDTKKEDPIIVPTEDTPPLQHEEPNTTSTQRPSEKPLTASQSIEAKAIKMKEELLKAEALKAEEQAALKAGLITFTPDDVAGIEKLKNNQPASIKGVVKLVEIPTAGSGLYISFSDPLDEKQNRVVIYQKSFDGGRYVDEDFVKIEEQLQKLVGKTVTFSGVVTRHVGKVEPHFIRIDSYDQISVEGETIAATIVDQNTIFTPEDAILIAKLQKNSPIKVKGTLKEAKHNTDKSCIILYFSKPNVKGQVRGVVYEATFKGTYELKAFDEFIDKEIILDGIVRFDTGRGSPLVGIDDLDQISTPTK